MSRRARGCALAALTVGLFAGSGLEVRAQGTVEIEGMLQRYTFDDPAVTSISVLELRSTLVRGAWPLLGRATVSFSSAWAEGTLEAPDGTSTSVSGLTDTQLLVGVRAGGGITVSAIGLLPTGLDSQTLSETRVAGAIGTDLFPFVVTNWGTGGGGGAMISVARRLGGVGAGLSVSYLVRRAFEPLDAASFAYRPGDVLTVVGALDGNPTEASKANLRVAWHHHSEDRVDGANLYRPGNRLEATASLAFPVGRGASGIVFGSLHHREGGLFLEFDESLTSQDLLRVGGGLRLPLGWATLQPDVQARLFRRADGREQGWDLGGGVEMEIPAGATTFVPGLRVHLGNLEMHDGMATNFTGLEISVAARFGSGR